MRKIETQRDFFDIEYNNTDAPLEIKNAIESIEYREHDEFLKYHQFIVKEYFVRNNELRGILMCYGTGLGKTLPAFAISNYYRENDPTRRIILLSSKSLQSNFVENAKKYLVRFYSPAEIDRILERYKFISLNAANMYKQVYVADKNEEELDFEKKLNFFIEDITKDSSLENSLLIIDEAHNLFNSICNGSKNAVALYDLIMRTVDLKLIFLSGTPIINDPFELVPCFNMLRGMLDVSEYHGGGDADDADDDQNSSADETDDADEPDDAGDDQVDLGGDSIVSAKVEIDDQDDQDDQDDADDQNEQNSSADDAERAEIKQRDMREKKKKIKNFIRSKKTNEEHQDTLFSELEYEFENYFIDRANKTIKNKEKFQNRIYGLVSYYGDFYFENQVKKDFPEELPAIVERVPMSQYQYSRYAIIRDMELEENKLGVRAKKGRFSSSKGGSTTYRVKSRQISNFAIPDHALGPARGQKSREKFIDRITTEELVDLEKYSPKMAQIYKNIEKYKNTPGIVYSQFVSGEGLAIFARVLDVNGWINIIDRGESETAQLKKLYDYDNNSFDQNGGKKKKNKNYYAMISGDIEAEKRQEIIDMFNRPENVDGSIIKLLLLSGAVAEGIDLKRGRHGHIMEPFWNAARIEQVKGRLVRYKSHADLPKKDQNVQFYIYLSDYPENIQEQLKKLPKEKTTDVELYENAIDSKKIITQFMFAMAEASIDCAIHYEKLTPEMKKKINCLLCMPNSKQLYHPILSRDMQLPNPCAPLREKKVKAHEIKIGEKKYYYTADGDDINIYQYSSGLKKYVKLSQNEHDYGAIMEKIYAK